MNLPATKPSSSISRTEHPIIHLLKRSGDATALATREDRFPRTPFRASVRIADELDTIPGRANSAAIEPPGTTLMLDAGFLALRVQVDVAEEFGKRVRA